jgi:hypothetical protein
MHFALLVAIFACKTASNTEVSFRSFLNSICGTLHSVDQYLNIKLTDINVMDPEKYPHMVSRGNVSWNS